jgi:hypothetical protein
MMETLQDAIQDYFQAYELGDSSSISCRERLSELILARLIGLISNGRTWCETFVFL